MKWYHYVACFFAGMFLANAIPHFVMGVCGNGFPTPFANPPGKGLSAPVINVYWGLFNILVGYFLYRGGKVSTSHWSRLTFFIGAAAISIMLANHFVDKMPQ